MSEFWNKRYAQEEYIYGKEPNNFFKRTIDRLNLKGKILFPGEGEGRNAVYAAKKGLEVVAYDISSEGKKKALQLAKSENVEIDYKVGSIEQLDFEENSFDAIVLIYAHFPPEKENDIHKNLTKLLKRNGYVILEGFSLDHIKNQEKNPKAGGPSNPNMLFSIEKIDDFFHNFEKIQLHETEIVLEEGDHHKGKANVIQFIGKKLM
ncbi:methyltransferase family protein [Balneicella halophila]|uniref:Methyltransferase family protein n=1 Tax=Balneicella halophila TaxID=1537566 RepID=A0A7L4UQ67_BALHA|nr:class I SAM-dependent methyltransferase [Balneicella halophila]PVX51819.1 methyltransferase family protein [Balneicella halophila]